MLQTGRYFGLHVDGRLVSAPGVRADNHAAMACYRKLGFEIVAPYGELMAERLSV